MGIPKIITSFKDAKSGIDRVLHDFTHSVLSTLGPLGKTIVLSSEGDEVPHVTKDGVTVSESIYYKDQLMNSVAALLKESARKTSEEVGDGTTTSVLLAISLIRESRKSLGVLPNFRGYLDGVDKAIDFVVEYLQEEVREVEMGSKELKGVINISSNNDADVTDMLVELTETIGPHGIIDVKVGDNNVTNVESYEGASIDSRVVVKPGTGKTHEVIVPANIVLVEGAIVTVNEIKNILTDSAASKIPLVIVAKEFSEVVINAVNVNNRNNSISAVLVEAEGFGNSRLEILKDIAAVTGATIVSTDGSVGHLLRSFQPDYYGFVSGLVATEREVILYCDKVNLELESTVKRKEKLIKEYEDNTDVTNNTLYRRRLSKFVRVATIYVGGDTKAQAMEAKDRIDDAVAAISAAVNGGVLPGGGAALIRAMQILEARGDAFEAGAEEWGKTAVMNLCEAPLHVLVQNAGFELPEDVIEKLQKNPNLAYDIVEKRIVDAYETGILDPALVLIKALANAAAVNRSIVNSNAFIIEENEV